MLAPRFYSIRVTVKKSFVEMSPSTFDSTSSETPSRIVVSFADDPAASLGVSLTNYDRVRFKSYTYEQSFVGIN